MQIIYNSKKNVGVVCPGQNSLIDHEKGIVSLPLELARGVEVYSFDCTFQGLEALQWAKFWLLKKDNRARTIGNYIPTPSLRKENDWTKRACKKSYIQSTKKYKISPIKMIAKDSSGLLW